jgi:hypothetical protein
VCVFRVYCLSVDSCLHPEDSGGSEAAELDFGDGVAGSRRVSYAAPDYSNCRDLWSHT